MEGFVVFSITGENIHPDLITRHIQLEPSRVIHPVEENDYKTLWQINSRLKGREPIVEHFRDILKRLMPVRKKLREFSRDAELIFFCSLIKQKVSPETAVIPQEILLVIGNLGASLEIDFKTTEL